MSTPTDNRWHVLAVRIADKHADDLAFVHGNSQEAWEILVATAQDAIDFAVAAERQRIIDTIKGA